MSKKIVISLAFPISISAFGALYFIRQTAVPDITQLQKLAEASCLCAMRADKSGSEQCWAKFNEKTRHLDGQAGATACAPISASLICFNIDGKDECVTTSYNLVTNRSDLFVCTKFQAKALQAVWVEADKKQRSNDLSVPDKVMEDAYTRLKRGLKVTAPSISDGCV